MRLWHVSLIDVLPRQQLLSQWREILYIKGTIIRKGSPHHLLVNEVLRYPLSDFKIYTDMVTGEMVYRGYNVNLEKYREVMAWDGENAFICGDIEDLHSMEKPGNFSESYAIFINWHNYAYLRQCLANLKEKYDRGGITEEEWQKIDGKFHDIISEMRI